MTMIRKKQVAWHQLKGWIQEFSRKYIQTVKRMASMEDYKRGVKAGMVTGAICGGAICAAVIYPLTGTVPMSLVAVAINTLGVHAALSEFIGDFIILGPLAGLSFAALFTKLPGKSSVTKAVLLLTIASIIQLLIAAIFGIRLYHPTNFYFIHLSTPLIFGILLGWLWKQFGKKSIKNKY